FRFDRNPEVAVDGVLTGGGNEESSLLVSVEVLKAGHRIPEGHDVDGAAFEKLLRFGDVGGVFDRICADVFGGEVDDLVHLGRVVVVLAERGRDAEQYPAAGDVTGQPHQQLTLQAFVGEILPVGQEVDGVLVVVDTGCGRGLEADRRRHV